MVFVFNLKPNRLKNINNTFEENIKLLNETSKINYFLSSNIEFKNNLINVFKYNEIKKDKPTVFRYISNIKIENNNIEIVV